MNTTQTQSDDLAQDLALVFGEAPLRTNVRPAAYHLGQQMDWDQAVNKAGVLIAGSQRSAWVGLHTLTIESLRAVVTLAQQTRGLLLPRPTFDSPLRLTQPVTQLGTLGHLMSCDLILGIGLKHNEMPVKLQQQQHAFEALPENLQTILDLSAAVHESLNQNTSDDATTHPFVRLLGKHKTVGVVLAADCDERVISQWHKLAASLQKKYRTAIMSLPHFEALNTRGVEAVIAWRTACSIATGGVDFSTDQPRSCPHWKAMLTPQSPVDLIIDTSLYPLVHNPEQSKQPSLIRIASSPLPHAIYSFVVPDMAAGIAGHVMRFDGIMLRLAGDAQHPLPDLTTSLLHELQQALTNVKPDDQTNVQVKS